MAVAVAASHMMVGMVVAAGTDRMELVMVSVGQEAME